MTGDFMIHDPDLSQMERLYVKILGAPISGLRIRCRRILPRVCANSSRQNIKILDVGSGTGVFAMEMARQNPAAQVTGLDNSFALVQKANEMAERAGMANCRFVTGDALDLGFSNEFDLAVCVDNLEHIEDDVRAMANIRHSLKQNGRAIIHVPNIIRRWPVFKWRVNFDVDGHVRPGYHLNDLTTKLKSTGFTIISSQYTYGFLETITNNLSFAITGAAMKNKQVYALVFPFLNALAWAGKNTTPKMGAGILVEVEKK